MFGWFAGRKRKKLMEADVTVSELSRLSHSLWQANHLPDRYRTQLVRWSRVLIAEKNWEGCNGLSVSAEMKWQIASQAGLMMLGYPNWFFDRTQTFLIYPRPYVAKVQSFNPGGQLSGEFYRAGETIYAGPVILNWNDVQLSARDSNEGNCLVIHELAHQLDMINGPSADGLPPLPSTVDEAKWRNAFKAEFDVAREMVEQGYRILMNDYGLTKESEFFAVASELYFQLPHALAKYHPNVFELLREFYLIDLREFLTDDNL